MNIIKLKKYINLALNNSSAGESSTAAKMFFGKLNSLGVSFNPAKFGLTRGEAKRLADLAGKIFKGLNDGSETETVKPKAKTQPAYDKESHSYNATFDDYRADGYRTKRACCYDYFHKANMNNSYTRRYVIDVLCTRYGFAKASVQSYASNFRKEFC